MATIPNEDRRTLILTGASRGIGHATVKRFSSAGWRVITCSRHEFPEDCPWEAGPEDHIQIDLANPANIEDGIAEMRERLKAQGSRLDALVNNAGWGRMMPLEELDERVFEDMWRTNILGAAMMAKHAVPHLRAAGGGSIVNIASTAALRGFAGGTAYASTKFGLAGMSQCWQAELRQHDIRVIQVNPSEVQTRFFSKVGFEQKLSDKKLRPSEIADAIVGALKIDDRGFIPELAVFATNPF